MSSPLTGPWYRVQAIIQAPGGRRAEHDFVSVLPAVLSAAQRGAPFVIGWLSRCHGALLELITNAGPVHTAEDGAPALGEADRGMLYPLGPIMIRPPGPVPNFFMCRTWRRAR